MALKAGFLIVLAILSVGCATTPEFRYRYYGLAQVEFETGFLLGPEVKDDLPFARCAGNACIVMFTDDFFVLMQEYLDLKNDLNACQKKAL